jgi:hypothetical protein
MMRIVLNKIFEGKLGPGKFILSGVAFLVGLSLVLLALQSYLKIKEFIAPQQSSSNYIILNKEVAMAHTLFGAKAQFSTDEIRDLRLQPFVADMGVFKTNNFEVRAYLGGNLGFYTELFFESVPSQFIDDRPTNFTWQEGSDFLPIIISQDFLNLYNFGYAVGRGTPQLSKSTIQLVPLKVEVSGVNGRKVFDAKVVGFSERIASVLVPENFLDWANDEIGGAEKPLVSRAIIKVKNDKNYLLEEYLEQNELKISDEKARMGKILSTMNTVLSTLVVIGTAFMGFALVIVLLNFSLMVAQAKEEVSLLIQLGYRSSDLVRHLLIYLIIFISTVSLMVAVIFGVGNYLLADFFHQNGLEISRTLSPEVVIAGICFVLLSLLLSYFSITRLIRKQL